MVQCRRVAERSLTIIKSPHDESSGEEGRDGLSIKPMPVDQLQVHRQIGRHLIWPEDATQNNKSAGRPWEYLNGPMWVLSTFLLRFALDRPLKSAILKRLGHSEPCGSTKEWLFDDFNLSSTALTT